MQRPIGCRGSIRTKPQRHGKRTKNSRERCHQNRPHALDAASSAAASARAVSTTHDREVDQHNAVFLDQAEEQRVHESVKVERHAKSCKVASPPRLATGSVEHGDR